MLIATVGVLKEYILEEFIISDETPLPNIKSDLENGIITVWGSSELTAQSLKYISNKFIPSEIGLPVTFHGHAYHQSFVIMTQIAAFYNKKIQENAKIVIFLSPGWFETKGTNANAFSEYMTPNVLSALITNRNIPSEFLYWTSEYIELSEYNNPSLPMMYISAYKYWNKEIKSTLSNEGSYKIIENDIDWEKLSRDAISLEAKKSSSNSFGINNEYYAKYIEPNIRKGKFPRSIKSIKSSENNQEYQDFLKLVELLKLMKIKPIFIMQDLNPHAYTNLNNYGPILKKVKKELESNDFPYLDMWSWDGKDSYINGKLTDTMHTGEVGWVEINRFILKYYGR